MGDRNRQQATIGRHVRTLPILTVADKMRVRVEAAALADERVRKEQAENARLRRDIAFDRQHQANLEIVGLRTDALKLTPKEQTREKHVLAGALSRHKSRGEPLKDFDPHEILNEDAIRHGKAMPVAPKDASPTQLPPSPQEGRVPIHDRAGFVAAQQPYALRSAAHREQELKDRQKLDAWYAAHPGLINPTVGSYPL